MGVITLGAKDFVRGVSISDNLSDGGYSNKNKGQNLLANVGCMSPIPSPTDVSTNVINNIIAINNGDTNSTASPDAIMVSQQAPTGAPLDTPAFGASFYTLDAGTSTLRQTDTNGDSKNRIFLPKYTDIVRYNGDVYVTSNNDVSKIIGGNMETSADYDWFSTSRPSATTLLSTGAIHRLLVWAKKLWITDRYKLHSLNGGVITDDELDLSGFELNSITAIANYEATGDMIIAVAPNIEDGSNQNSKILLWDGNISVPNREIHTKGFITAFFNHGGVTYVFYNNMFGYFNGSGITPLRRLNITQSWAALDSQYIGPAKVTSINDTIYIAEDKDVLAYGPLYPNGNRIFYYPYKEGRLLHSIHGYGDDKMIVAAGSTSPAFVIELNTIDVTTAGDESDFITNVYDLPSNSSIRKIEVLFERPLVTNDRVDISIYPSDNPNTATTPANGSITFATLGAKSEHTIRGIDVDTASVQLLVQWVVGSTPIRQIKIYYDSTEKPV